MDDSWERAGTIGIRCVAGSIDDDSEKPCFPPAPPAPTPPKPDYTEHLGSNAYLYHGGIPVGEDHSVLSGGTVAECTALCDDNPLCSCVTFKSSTGECWLRSGCVPSDFDKDASYDTYQKPNFSYKAFSGANAYHGHGGEPIGQDSPVTASSGSVIECKSYCDANPLCECVTHKDTSCWLRSDCVPGLFAQESTYTSYVKQAVMPSVASMDESSASRRSSPALSVYV